MTVNACCLKEGVSNSTCREYICVDDAKVVAMRLVWVVSTVISRQLFMDCVIHGFMDWSQADKSEIYEIFM